MKNGWYADMGKNGFLKRTISSFGINSSELIANNIIHIIFTEAVYGNSGATLPIESSDFTFTYTDNSDTVVSCELIDITKTDNTALTGGETEIYAHLYVIGSSDGKATVKMDVNTDSVYDASGTAMVSTQTTGELSMVSDTIDYITDVKGVTAYMDANDTSTIDETSDFVWSDVSNVGMMFSQSNASYKPVNNIAVNQSLTFERGDYLESDTPIILDANGWSVYFAFYKNAGTHIIISSSDYKTLGTAGQINFIKINDTSMQYNVGGSGSGIIYTFSIGWHLVELRYVPGTMQMYDNGVAAGAAKAVTFASHLRFNRIGSDSATEGVSGYVRNLTVYNGTNTTYQDLISTFLQAKFIGQTITTNTRRTLYKKSANIISLIGDSNAVGRAVISALTSNYQYVLGEQVGGYIWDNFGTSLRVRTDFYDPNIRYAGENTIDEFGIESSLFYWSLQAGKYIGICKAAIGGTYLGNTGAATDWNRAAGESFKLLVWGSLAIKQFMKSQLFECELNHMIIMLGYNDTTDAGLTAAWSANMAQFKTDIRDCLNNTILKIRTHNIQNGDGKDTINNANIALAEADENHSHSTFTDGMTLLDGVHYNADSLVKIGKNDFDTWFNL